MKNKSKAELFFDRLLLRTRGWYPMLMVAVMQIVNTPLLILLTAMPAQQNAEFTTTQGRSLLIVGIIAVSVRNALLLGQFYLRNADLIKHLQKLGKPEAVDENPVQEKHAWALANSASNL